jgi:hypothetical protein
MNTDPPMPRSTSSPNTLTHSNTQPTSEASGDTIAAPQLTLQRGFSDSASATLDRQLRHDDSKRRAPGSAAGESWSDAAGDVVPDAPASAGSSLAVTEAGIAPGQSMVGTTATHLGAPRMVSAEDREMYHNQLRSSGQMPTPKRTAAYPGMSALRVNRLTRNQAASNRPTPIRIEDAEDWRRVFGVAQGIIRDDEASRTEDVLSTPRTGQSTTAEEPQGKKRVHDVGAETTEPTAVVSDGSSSKPINLARSSQPIRAAPTTAQSMQSEPLASQAQSPARRASSNIVLPPWQPDNEADSCTVCKTSFSLWYRRHHCRKCGRVVCSNCSPHRITIPRQFIVQHPAEVAMQRLSTGSGLAARLAQDYERERILALDGAETVRVCNPCVPDPNLSPPPQLAASPSLPPVASTAFSLPASDGLQIPERGPLRVSTAATSQSSTQRSSQGYAGYQFLNPSSSFAPPINSARPAVSPSSAFSSSSLRQQATLNAQLAGPHHRHSVQGPISSQRQPQNHGRTTSLPHDHTQTPAVPRRVVKEEDECPICGLELPPKGSNGDETAREQHVVDCIASYSAPTGTSLPTPSALTSAMAPQAGLSPQAAASGGGNVPSISGPSSSSASSVLTQSAAVSIPASRGRIVGMAGSSSSSVTRPSASSSSPHTISRLPHHHAPRMLVYYATEKDCVDLASGEPQECVICFEEFEEGDEMGRLECLCKFHRACIRGWWERKGVGSCPTHQLGVWE